MRAAVYHSYGDPSVLSVQDVPEPHAGPGQVRIRAAAASVNPVDWKFRAGYMAEFIPVQFPAIPGNDAAGLVDELAMASTGYPLKIQYSALRCSAEQPRKLCSPLGRQSPRR